MPSSMMRTPVRAAFGTVTGAVITVILRPSASCAGHDTFRSVDPLPFAYGTISFANEWVWVFGCPTKIPPYPNTRADTHPLRHRRDRGGVRLQSGAVVRVRNATCACSTKGRCERWRVRVRKRLCRSAGVMFANCSLPWIEKASARTLPEGFRVQGSTSRCTAGIIPLIARPFGSSFPFNHETEEQQCRNMTGGVTCVLVSRV